MALSLAAHAEQLRRDIVRSLRQQGFRVRNNGILPPLDLSKESIRSLHRAAVAHRIEAASTDLKANQAELLGFIASGSELDPEGISPRLVEVKRGSIEELLFRYASLHWSIPVSSGYGRRLRYLVIDEQNDKLIGLIGLGDPVFALRPRDSWVGWTPVERKRHLRHVMDAFVLGAVPPYSFLLCGKLVAMLASTNSVRRTFKRKYGGAKSVMSGRIHDGQLAMLTTTSALGRSSIYNRLRIEDRRLFQSVGFTQGSGDFHFSDGLYGAISEFAHEHVVPSAKDETWGTGFRNRREIIRKTLSALGLPWDWIFHGIEREVFVVPLARNTVQFLRGEQSRLLCYSLTEAQASEHFRDRWLLPRVAWDQKYRQWSNSDWLLWKS